MSRKRRKPRSEVELKSYKVTNFVNDKIFSPIETSSVKKLADAAIKILTEIGMSDAPEELCELVLEHGGKLEKNRLIYPPELITNTIEQHPRIILLAGQTIENDLHVGGNYVYAGTGGAAPNLQKPQTNECVEWEWANVTYLMKDECIYKVNKLGINIAPGGGVNYFTV